MKKECAKQVERASITLECRVNGKPVRKEIDSGMTLIDFLRRVLGLTGTKEGCGQGECGACVVVVDDRAVNSCIYMAAQAQGKEIMTIEGVAGKDGGLHPIQKAYMEEGGVQCGFCTPGFVMTTYALLKRNPKPTREEIVEALSGNICRCTGYEKIFRAVERARDSR